MVMVVQPAPETVLNRFAGNPRRRRTAEWDRQHNVNRRGSILLGRNRWPNCNRYWGRAATRQWRNNVKRRRTRVEHGRARLVAQRGSMNGSRGHMG